MIETIIRKHSRALVPQETEVTPSFQPIPGIKAVLFDVYGTLFVSASGDISLARKGDEQVAFLDALLVDFGIAGNAEVLRAELVARIKEEHERANKAGVDYPEVVIEDIWAGLLGIDDIPRAKRFALMYELAVNPVYPMPHLAETLSFLKETSFLLGIISNAQFFTPYLFPAFLDASLEDFGFANDLQFYSFAYGYAKPSRFLYERAKEALASKGVATEETLYIGNDMRNDIMPAARLGFRTALFAGDARSLRMREGDPLVHDIHADAVLTDLRDIQKILN